MIQFNLLPDVKIDYIKTRYRKRLIMLASGISSGIFLVVFIVLFLYVRVNQPRYMDDLSKDINSNLKTLQSTQDLDKILTIQSQLNSLPDLHSKKVVSSRLIDYLTKVTPNQVTLSDISVDFDATTMSLKGNTDTLESVNKFVDTLKFTNYTVNDSSAKKDKAFKDVVLQSFSVGVAGQANSVSYEISLSYDPVIFSQVQDVQNGASEPVTLSVPSITSSRSETEKPGDLFAPQPNNASQNGGQ